MPEYPLTIMQRRFWGTQRRLAGTAALQMGTLLRVRGLNYDTSHLPATLAKLVASQDALRTVFGGTAEAPVQVVLPQLDVELTEVSVDGETPEARLAAGVARASQLANTPFDIHAGPLFCVAVLWVGDDDFLLLIVANHMIADGYSVSLIANALLWRAVPPVATSFAAYARGQALALRNGGYEKWIQEWRETLVGAPAQSTLATDRPRTADWDPAGDNVLTEVDPGLSESVRALAKDLRRTPMSVLLTAHLITLARRCGHDDPVVALPTLGRRDSALGTLVGVLHNPVPLRVGPFGSLSIRELIDSAHRGALTGFDRCDLPYPVLVEALGPEFPVGPGERPIAQTQFNLIPGDDPIGGRMAPPVMMTGCSSDLVVHVHETARAYEVAWQYPTALYDSATILAYAGEYERVLRAICADPSGPVAALLSGGLEGADAPGAAAVSPPAPLLPYRVASAPWAMPVVALSHAGGAASAFRGWAELLGEDYDLWAVQLPGREGRHAETAHTQMDAAVGELIDGLAPFLQGPWALLGHSCGADIAFALTRELEARGLRAPERLFLAAQTPPHVRDISDPVHKLAEPELLERLAGYGGTPPELLENAELLELVLPRLRADFELWETYTLTADETVSVPITVLGGLHDRTLRATNLERWGELTSGGSTVEWYDGAHFFIHEETEEICAMIDATLASATTPGVAR